MSGRAQIYRKPALCALIIAIGIILLGPQNRLYRANDNWIYTGKGDFVVVSIIAVLLLVIWGILVAIRNTPSTLGQIVRDPQSYVDGMVVMIVLSCATNRFTLESAVYLVTLLAGVVICKLVALGRLDRHETVGLLSWIVGLAAVIALTNLMHIWLGWMPAGLQPSKWFYYGVHERASLWFGNPNDLGCVMAVAVVLVIGLLRNVAGLGYRIALALSAVVFMTMLIETFSRGAVVGLAAGLLVYLVRGAWDSRRIGAVVVMVILLAIGIVGNGVYSSRLKSVTDVGADGSIGLRLLVWQDSLKMIKEHPVVGVGLGNFGLEFAAKERARGLPGYSTAMNNVLTLGVESGVLSVLLYLSFIASAIKAGLSDAASYQDERRGSGHALASALCVLIVCGLFTYSLCKLYYCISWVIVGLICSDWQSRTRAFDL